MALRVDEKTQIQALDRTKPLLPMGLGYVEGVTHDYIRHHGTHLSLPSWTRPPAR
jgi:putative transposase